MSMTRKDFMVVADALKVALEGHMVAGDKDREMGVEEAAWEIMVAFDKTYPNFNLSKFKDHIFGE